MKSGAVWRSGYALGSSFLPFRVGHLISRRLYLAQLWKFDEECRNLAELSHHETTSIGLEIGRLYAVSCCAFVGRLTGPQFYGHRAAAIESDHAGMHGSGA